MSTPDGNHPEKKRKLRHWHSVQRVIQSGQEVPPNPAPETVDVQRPCKEQTQSPSTSSDVVQRSSDANAASQNVTGHEVGRRKKDIGNHSKSDGNSTDNNDIADASNDGYTYSSGSGKEDKTVNINHNILVIEWVMERMYKTIQEVLEIFDDLESTMVRIGLTRYKWDKQPFLEAYCLRGESKFINAIVRTSCQPSRAAHEGCSTCLYTASVVKEFEMIELTCGHKLHAQCLTHYVLTKRDWDKEPFVKCLRGCNAIVSDENVTKMLTTEDAKYRFRMMMANSYVENNRTLRWCPKPGCGRIIENNFGCSDPENCVCNVELCNECGKIHEPVPCLLFRKWMEKYEDVRSKNLVEYLTLSTKDCPNCNTIIEKNGGYNMIQCLNCKALFCWFCVCLLTSEEVKSHRCNRTNLTPTEMRIAEFKHELQRFAFYYLRYEQHLKSSSTEEQLIMAKINAYKSYRRSRGLWCDSKYLMDAFEALNECRRTLQLTYIFAYFLEDSNELRIFDGNQRDLERFVQLMSAILVSEVNEEKKCRVMDLTKYCKRRRQALLDHVKEGYDKDWWHFVVESRIDTI